MASVHVVLKLQGRTRHVQVLTLDQILAGPPAIKILFMSTEERIQEEALPHFEAALAGTSADWTQAVDTMLEVVPKGEIARLYWVIS